MADRLSNRRRKEISKLTRRKYRKRVGEALVEGVRLVESAVTAGAPLIEVLVTRQARADPRVQQLLSQIDVPVLEAEEAEFERLSDVQASQGILAVVERQLAPGEALLACGSQLVLDGVQDPGNVGTLLRTAAWFGVEAVVGGEGTAGFYNPKVLRAAMGGHWDLKLSRTDATPEWLARLSASGIACYGADLEGTAVRAWEPAPPSALVMGSEAHGLDEEVRAQIDERISIPGRPRRGTSAGATESLNVAVSAGILVYEWMGP